MPEQSGDAKDGWVSRYRHRRVNGTRVESTAGRGAEPALAAARMTLRGRPKAGTSKAEGSSRRRAARSPEFARRRGDLVNGPVIESSAATSGGTSHIDQGARHVEQIPLSPGPAHMEVQGARRRPHIRLSRLREDA
jgi:hypothetical protein